MTAFSDVVERMQGGGISSGERGVWQRRRRKHDPGERTWTVASGAFERIGSVFDPPPVIPPGRRGGGRRPGHAVPRDPHQQPLEVLEGGRRQTGHGTPPGRQGHMGTLTAKECLTNQTNRQHLSSQTPHRIQTAPHSLGFGRVHRPQRFTDSGRKQGVGHHRWRRSVGVWVEWPEPHQPAAYTRYRRSVY